VKVCTSYRFSQLERDCREADKTSVFSSTKILDESSNVGSIGEAVLCVLYAVLYAYCLFVYLPRLSHVEQLICGVSIKLF